MSKQVIERFLLVNWFFLIIFLLLDVKESNAEMTNINNHQLLSLIDEDVPIIDIREESEWKETGIIEGSYLITFFDSNGKYDLLKWLSSIKNIADNEDPVIILCRSGRRSAILGNMLVSNANYREVYNVSKGIKGWIKEDLAIKEF